METAVAVQDRVTGGMGQAGGDLSLLDSMRVPRGNLKECELRLRQACGEVRASLALAALVLCDPIGNWDAAIATLQDIVDGQRDKAFVAQAKSLLADAWVKGLGGLTGCEQARGYYIDAAQDGVPGAAYALGCWYLGTNPRFASSWPDRELAAHFFETGALAGSGACAKALASLHLARELRFSSRSMAIELLTQAANEGDAQAGAMLTDTLEAHLVSQLLCKAGSLTASGTEPGPDVAAARRDNSRFHAAQVLRVPLLRGHQHPGQCASAFSWQEKVS